MNYIIFGGTGFIGTHLIKLLKEEIKTEKDHIYALDIVMPGEEGVVPGIVEKIEGVEYVRCDVRKTIELPLVTTKQDIIFNLAAVHRTPGHPDYEYFETNIKGAENVTAFAEQHNINRILFTSSIAPYGAAEELKKETTLPTPNTPYGISKLVAEKIHEKWQNGDRENRCLTILRPGVVYGKGEHGNFTRMYWGIRKRYFIYPGRKDTIKACIYVKELVHFMKYRMIDNDFIGTDIFNCTYEPAFSTEQICETMKKETAMKRHTFLVPGWILKAAAVCAVPFGGKKLGLHPERVKKLMISTNVSGEKLAESDYSFHYEFGETLADWFADCNNKGLE